MLISIGKNRLKQTNAALLVFALVLGMLLRLSMLGYPPSTLFERCYLIDDSYYLFAEARELAAGKPFHVSPYETGNGIQPLFYLIASAVFRLAGDDDSAIRWVLLISAMFGLATAWMLSQWAWRLGARRSAWIAGALWALSPAVFEHEMNGLETALDMFVLSTLGACWPRLARRPFILGTYLGITYLARVDNMLLAPGLVLLCCVQKPWQAQFSSSGRWRIAYYSAWLVAGVAWIVLPYMGASGAWTGRIFPQSGKAITWYSQLPFAYQPDAIFNEELIITNVKSAVEMIWWKTQLHLLGASWRPEWVRWWWQERPVGLICGLSYLLVMLIAIISLRAKLMRGAARLWPAPVFLLTWLSVYIAVVGGYWYFSRYFHGYLLGLSILPAWLFRHQWRPGRKYFWLGAACIALFGMQSASQLTFQLSREIDPTVASVYHGLDTTLPLLKPGENAGSLQSGYVGYITRGRFRNLDGIVSERALRARLEGNTFNFLIDERIAYVVEWPELLTQFLDRTVPQGSVEFIQIEPLRPYVDERNPDGRRVFHPFRLSIKGKTTDQ